MSGTRRPRRPAAPPPDNDGDGVADLCDACPGHDDTADADNDGVADGCDLCQGDDATVDGDGDRVCADLDCDDTGDEITCPDICGVCGGRRVQLCDPL